MNVPSVLRPPSTDTMAGVIPTHEPPSLPLEMGQNVNQNIYTYFESKVSEYKCLFIPTPILPMPLSESRPNYYPTTGQNQSECQGKVSFLPILFYIKNIDYN